MGFVILYGVVLWIIFCIVELVLHIWRGIRSISDKRHQKQLEEKTRQEEERRKQLQQSEKYNRLCEIFNDLRSYRIPITLRLKSLNEFRAYNKTVALDMSYSEICAKYRFFTDNLFLDKFYAVAALPANASDYVRQKEEEAYQTVNKAIHTPVKVTWSYTSPAGVNHYEDSAYVTFEDLQEYTRHRDLRQQRIDQEKYRRERERQMMTRSLRYEIMKRDNFRCQICGRTAQDGARLEVDHKKPIAKGGRTEPSNLWTLCQDCNRGKGAKYDS